VGVHADDIELKQLMEATVTKPAHVIVRRFPAEVVVLNLQSGLYHGLNLTAGDMLEVLLTGLPVRRAADRIASEYAADVSRVRAGIVELCTDLRRRGLIELHLNDG
jgi:hypothetical protein